MKSRQQQRGSILVLVLVGLVAMLAMVGLALDSGHAMLSKTRLQNTVDAAALSAAKELDLTDDTLRARNAALLAFSANAASGGHKELGEAYASGSLNVVVQFSETLDPFVPGTSPAEYVRVRATNFNLSSWFASLVTSAEKTVAATAVAGPSPTINTACNIAPMMVCGDPAAGPPYWGYSPGEPDVLKASTGGSDVGPGNFQLIRLGDNAGGADIRTAMAGNYDGCASGGDTVTTEPGNTVEPVVSGINTRFGDHTGSLAGTESKYPPDVIVEQPSPLLSYDSSSDTIYQGSAPVGSEDSLSYGYREYTDALDNGNLDFPFPTGRYDRRVVAIPIGDCSTATNGSGSVPILGFGCYFLLQKAKMKGNESHVYGQFIESCNGGGYPGPAPGAAPGLYVIQLYKDPDGTDA